MSGPEYLDITVPFQTNFTHHVHKDILFLHTFFRQGLFRPSRGVKYRQDQAILPETLVIFEDGDSLSISTDDEARGLFWCRQTAQGTCCVVRPHCHEYQEELRSAFEEYENGTFLKHARK